jgi:phosphoglycolate phosphatase
MTASIKTDDWSIDRVEAVIFDKDGTLINHHLYWGEIIRRRADMVIKQYKLDETMFTLICSAMGLSLNDDRLLPDGPVGLVSRDGVIRALCSCLSKEGVETDEQIIDQLFIHVHDAFLPDIDKYIQLIPSAVEFIYALHHAGVKKAVVTSDTVQNTKATLMKLDIDKYFDVIIGKDSTSEVKISGIPALKALEILHVQPAMAVCIGDAPMDLIMGKSSGCKAGIGVTTGQVIAEILNQYTPYVIKSMMELKVANA